MSHLTRAELRSELERLAEEILAPEIDSLADRIKHDVQAELRHCLGEKSLQDHGGGSGGNTAETTPVVSESLHVPGGGQSAMGTNVQVGGTQTSANLEVPRQHYRPYNAAQELKTDVAMRELQMTLDSVTSIVPVNYETTRSDGTFDEPVRPQNRHIQKCAMNIVTNKRFDYVATSLVILNGIMIGVQTEYVVTHGSSNLPPEFGIIDIFFCVAFTVELFLRLFAFGRHFFVMQGWKWNVFDCVIVGAQVVEQLSVTFAFGISSNYNFSAMRMLRALRLIRVMRMLRVMRLVHELRMIVVSILSCIRCLMWTVVLLLVMMYVVAIYITQLVADQMLAHGDEGGAREYFGSLGRSTLTLYQAISGGISWNDAVVPLMLETSPFMGVFFAFYIAISTLAIMNVVTGVFVESALATVKNDKDVVMMNNVRELYDKADVDSDGFLTWPEFESKLSSKAQQEIFKGLDIDTDDAYFVFCLLDTEGVGRVNLESLMNGCLRLRGEAKAVDVMTIMHESRQQWCQLSKQIADVQKGCLDVQVRLQRATGLSPSRGGFSGRSPAPGHLMEKPSRSSVDGAKCGVARPSSEPVEN